ncbi:hypothetical protein LMH73_022115 [Vibrio splendidus]|nr:hypothetical protein [Vibrio splendidus]MCC4882483.1 hypothetical protein [Vibrio splendidus]
MFNSDKINVNELFDKGYTLGFFYDVSSKKILKGMNKLTWVNIRTHDSATENSNFIAIESLASNENLPRVVSQYMGEFNQWSHPLLSQYERFETFSLRLLCSTKGFSRSIHNDVNNRSVLNATAFFGDNLGNPSNGGVINVYRVDVRDPNNLSKMTFLESITPTQGMVLIFNNMDPSLRYEMTEITNPDVKLFQVSSKSCPITTEHLELNIGLEPGFHIMNEPGCIKNPQSILDSIKP